MRKVTVYEEGQDPFCGRTAKIDFEGYFLEFGIMSGVQSSASAAIVEDMAGFTHLVPIYLLQFREGERANQHQ